jgi:hypothetical protein
MTGVIGALAKLTVVEDDNGPRVVRWQPFDRQLTAAESRHGVGRGADANFLRCESAPCLSSMKTEP